MSELEEDASWRVVGRRTIRAAVAALALTSLGYLMVGAEVLPVVPVVLFVGVAWRRDPGRPLAFVAIVMLILAALGTVLGPLPNAGWGLNFPSDRQLANDAARLTVVLVAMASVLLAYSERSRFAPVNRPLVDRDLLGRLGDVATVRRPRWSGPLGPSSISVLAVAVGALVRVLAAPAALLPFYDPLITNLRLGTQFSFDSVTNLGPPATVPPMAPLAVAFVPLAPQALLMVTGVTVMVVCGQLGRRLGGPWGRAATLVVAALLPSMWLAPLTVALAGFGLVAAVSLLVEDPVERALTDVGPTRGNRTGRNRVTGVRALWAGAFLGFAVMARPETALVVPLVIVWAWDRGTAPTRLLQMAAAAAVTVAPWWIWVHEQVGGVLPASSLASFLNDPSRGGRTVGLTGWLIPLAVLSATFITSRRAGLLQDCWILIAVPVLGLLLAFTDLPARDPLGWSAPLLAVAAGSTLGRAVQSAVGSARSAYRW